MTKLTIADMHVGSLLFAIPFEKTNANEAAYECVTSKFEMFEGFGADQVDYFVPII